MLTGWHQTEVVHTDPDKKYDLLKTSATGESEIQGDFASLNSYFVHLEELFSQFGDDCVTFIPGLVHWVASMCTMPVPFKSQELSHNKYL